jgi:hypothetical protein
VRSAALRVACSSVGPADLSVIATKVCEKSGIGIRAVNAEFKRAQQEMKEAAEASRRKRERQADARPERDAPRGDAPVAEVSQMLDAILASDRGPLPPFRNSMGHMARLVRTKGAETGRTSPGWRMVVASPLDVQVAVERAVALMRRSEEEGDREVALQHHFAVALAGWSESKMPAVAAVLNLPVVGPDLELIAGDGLLREHALIMRCPQDIVDALPTRRTSVREAQAAFNWLCEHWLVDVATDVKGKAAAISAALTMIQRARLPQRPAFLADAGLRGGGKTTLIRMLAVAADDFDPPTQRWSGDAEERKKMFFAAAREGISVMLIDNIPNGATWSDATLDMVVTTGVLTDRVLGESRTETLPWNAVVCGTGNNISVQGDTSSRVLQIRLEVDTPHPEDREFTHHDPVGWTRDNRAEILRNLFTVLMVERDLGAVCKTRFKDWWRQVGGPLEIASGVDLSMILKESEADDVSATAMLELMTELQATFPQVRGEEMPGVVTRPFKSDLVADAINQRMASLGGVTQTPAAIRMQEALEAAAGSPFAHGRPVTPKLVGSRLRKLRGRPVLVDGVTLKLVGLTDRMGVLDWVVASDCRGGAVQSHGASVPAVLAEGEFED